MSDELRWNNAALAKALGLQKNTMRVGLTFSEAIAGMQALAELHRVCLAMDADRQADRPSESEYQAAMAAAGKALASWSAGRAA